ncbi:chemotaxis protein CheW [Desulfoluna spongiiphila]|nr:chemotaxis protein CheW [Desulfoluna spongiiphila]
MHSYLSFTVGPLNLGVDMTSVVSIDQGSPEHAGRQTALRLGSVLNGGEAVPLYSASHLFGTGDSCRDASPGTKTVILRFESGIIALSVDRVGKVMEGSDADMAEMPPVFTGLAKALFPKVLHGPGGWVPLISPDAVEQAVLWASLNPVATEAPVPDEPAADPGAAEPFDIPDAGTCDIEVDLVPDDFPFEEDAGAPDIAFAVVPDDFPFEGDAEVPDMVFSVLADEPAFEVDLAAMAGGDPSEDGSLVGPEGEWPVVDQVEPPDLLAPDPLSHELGAAITPGLLEKVVRRVVQGMMTEIVSELVTGPGEGMETES